MDHNKGIKQMHSGFRFPSLKTNHCVLHKQACVHQTVLVCSGTQKEAVDMHGK